LAAHCVFAWGEIMYAHRKSWPWLMVAALLGFLLGPFVHAGSPVIGPLRLVGSTDLPGFTGDFDHFAADLKGNRLFLAGEDHKTVEVFDLRTGKRIHSILGFGAPHSILYLPSADELYVTDGESGTVDIFRGNDYQAVGKIQLLAGADSAGYDAATGIYYVVTGGKDVPLDYSVLAAVDLAARKKVGELRFESNHVEAMALEKNGPRIFINVTDKGQVAVVDRRSMKLTASWPVGVAQQNSPIALDEATHRLFVICRQPPTFVAMDTRTGALITSLPTAGRADDVALDLVNRRIYVPGGEGYIAVYHQESPNSYDMTAKVPSALGAKTTLLVPEINRLFVAASPGDSKEMAKLLIFAVQP
jgi:DNA-binding beta-propeller fold protein YncE